MDNFLEEMVNEGARIKVIGAGGGGGNAVDSMIEQNIQGVDFCVMNTDIQAIKKSKAPEKVQLGVELTKGRGAGADPQVGKRAAEENIEDIKASLKGYDLVFVTAGLGGGSGTGAAPVIAKTAREMGILTVAVVTLPFGFEGKPRMRKAIAGKNELVQNVDTYIVIPNDRLTKLVSNKGRFTVPRAFEEVNNVLANSVRGITELITKPGLINLDFADIRTVMSMKGSAVMGMGAGKGEDRIRIATEAAINNQLLDNDISGAKGIILNITANEDLEYEDFVLANTLIMSQVDEECEVFVGTSLDETIPEDTVMITVVATGFEDEELTENPKIVSGFPFQTNQQTKPVPNTKESVLDLNDVFEDSLSGISEEDDEFVTKKMSSIYDALNVPKFVGERLGQKRERGE